MTNVRTEIEDPVPISILEPLVFLALTNSTMLLTTSESRQKSLFQYLSQYELHEHSATT